MGGGVFNGVTYSKNTSDSLLQLIGGTAYNTGAYIALYGKEHPTNGGQIECSCKKADGTAVILNFSPDGTAKWNGKNLAMQEDVIPRSGGAVITGENIGRDVNTSRLNIWGGSNMTSGGRIILYGSEYSTVSDRGRITLQAFDGSENSLLTLYPSGTFTFSNNGTIKNLAMQEDVVPRSGGAVISGGSLGRNIDTSFLRIDGGTTNATGASMMLSGKDHTGAQGRAAITCENGSSNKNMMLFPSGSWTWDGTACQITSDQRLKQQIAEIDDKLLDAWQDVTLCQFKYNESVDIKGKSARLHTGYVVQQIDTACKSHNVDISAYGLYCHEEYPEETEEVEVEQDDGTKTKETKVIREASEHYSLRYTEVYAVECAYLRREISRLKEELKVKS